MGFFWKRGFSTESTEEGEFLTAKKRETRES